MSQHLEESNPIVSRVAQRFFRDISSLVVEPLDHAGGFSGAALWRIRTASGQYCLKQWPGDLSLRNRLEWIHQFLLRIASLDVPEIPTPVLTQDGRTLVVENGYCWDLAPWMPGVANYQAAPNVNKLASAMRFLGRFHLAAAKVGPCEVGEPPGLVARCEQIRSLLNGQFEALRRATAMRVWPHCRPAAQRITKAFPEAAPYVLQQSAEMCKSRVPLHPCIRDIWHDHVLFSGDQVTGVIDYDALRVDHVAADLSRLLTSLVGFHPAARRIGLEAYVALRPLTVVERQMIVAYDLTSALLSGITWLRWLFVEGRDFPDTERVYTRINECADRLDEIVPRSPIVSDRSWSE